MIGQNDGVVNENQIVIALNQHEIKSLSAYQKAFIKQMFEAISEDELVYAKKIGGQGFKPDVEIDVAGEKHFVSVKKGGGNSVHQEKTDLFIHYCMNELDMSEEEKESLLLFLYGDGTIDGDSLPEERLSDQELLDTFKHEIEITQSFLDRNKRSLIERFLVYGRRGKEKGIKADYLYHGDANEGVWCPLDFDAIDYLVNEPNTKDAPLSIGPLTLQVWNRNLEGKLEMESRRHSIQIKWGSCKVYISKINEYYLSLNKDKVKENANKKRKVGDNSQGFENQDNLIALMDKIRVSELPYAVKNIVTTIFPNVAASERVRAEKIVGNDVKPRVAVNIKDEKRNLTIFMGSGNAVHQEKLQNFIDYCRNTLGMTVTEENALRIIMYGDGTLDGDSLAENRLKNTEEVKKRYKNQVDIAQKFFVNNKKALIERFLVYGKGGKQKNIKADFIYYGTDATGRIVPYTKVVDYLMQKEESDSALLSLGSLTIQPWNRNPEAKPNLESRRHSVQIKWGSMKQDLSKICEEEVDRNKGTRDGSWEEYELVSKLNRDLKRTGKLWETIGQKLGLEDLTNVYAVRVSNTVYSKLSERMVQPKADVYLVRGDISHEVLLDNNFWLDEDVIQDLRTNVISDSGISCKRPTSKNFTYIKLTIKSFDTLFNNRSIGAGISLFVNEKDLHLNHKVIVNWRISENTFLNEYCEELKNANIPHYKWNVECLEACKVIKNVAIQKMRQMIIDNRDIAEAIFYGKGVFEEPYTANFIYKNGQFMTTHIPEFTITTGSGRHKGTYTIIVKP